MSQVDVALFPSFLKYFFINIALNYLKSGVSCTQIMNFGHVGQLAVVSEVFNIELLKKLLVFDKFK